MSKQKAPRVSAWDVLRVDIPKLHAANSAHGIDATPAARFLLRLRTEYHAEYQTRVFYCPPLPLLWSFASRSDSPAAVIHRKWARALWAERRLGGRLRLCAMFALWPALIAGTIVWFTGLQGRQAREKCGKGLVRQAWEQLRIAAVHGILPPWYYVFELFDDQRGQRAGLYLRRDETKGGIYRMLRRPGRHHSMKDKLAFAQRCDEHGIATPRHLLAKDGALLSADGDEATLPQADLFAKPRRGRGGRGTQQWEYRDDAWERDGVRFSEPELREHFASLSRQEAYLVQQRLENHHELAELSHGVLTTVRIVTCRNERGEFEATNAAFRMALEATARVDNFHAGGIAAAVGMQSGELGRASDVGVRPASSWHANHPRLGAVIEGRKLPYWREAVELACRAHAAFPTFTVAGWDIALCDDGPYVIEGNSGADLDIIQRTLLAPLGDRRLGELLAHHLKALEKGPQPEVNP
jgi:glutathione synthase/RimK-type ligase-like ATP-grasp enzyme